SSDLASALRPDGRAPVFFEKPFQSDLANALQSWYDRGVRLFVFDGLDLTRVPPVTFAGLSNDGLVAVNIGSLRAMFMAFRVKNRGAVLFAIESDADYSDSSANPPLGRDTSASDFRIGSGAGRHEEFFLISTGPPHHS